MDNAVVLATAYLPPVQYFTKFLLGRKVYLENDENYTKQTYRNRCLISGPNGILALTVPVLRGSFHKTHLRDIRVDYNNRWLDNHSRALASAYRASPFYEYYITELLSVAKRKPVFLLDLNNTLLEMLLGFLHIHSSFNYTGHYNADPDPQEVADYRESLHPKHKLEDPLFYPAPYPQVFSERFGFLPNLSIVDLLFNMGPDAGAWVKKSTQAR